MSEYILTADYFDQIVEVREDGTAKRYAKRRRGDIIVGLPEDDVDRLLRAGAIKARADVAGPAARQEPDGGNSAPVTGTEVGSASAGGAETPSPDAFDLPKRTAKTEEWQDYAVARGLPRADAEAMSRAELIEKFGA
ncbi:hypothetical protein ACW2Q0_00550 [Nocardia sp. R16R-3T]